MIADSLGIAGRVILTLRDAQGNILEQSEHKNTITNWTRALIASFLSGSMTNIFVGTSQVQPSLPYAIALGTGTGTPQLTDTNMYSETYGTRQQYTYRDVLNGYYAQTVVQYPVNTSGNPITYTEAGLWDQLYTSTTLTGPVSSGDREIGVDNNAPSMLNGQQLYIADSTNPEYATVSGSYSAGQGSWFLQGGLQYSHAMGTTVYCFSGNLLAHVVFQGNGVTVGPGEQLTAQWQIYAQNG
ncbi:hypothetical protein [Alicyclobacillus fastidiosus]|uniref:Uncharacterized protein n=1 Tax=Alicyclobacillus fastidiosus TaxID=392011 RepID=A0ABV5ALS4_9BACL|nr:hypothetical protein [Alicyclobacillus fastidiosus]WEH08470.1 hypothetical protein PYS47_17505 [Alicyclobacillus fastidiosus]